MLGLWHLFAYCMCHYREASFLSSFLIDKAGMIIELLWGFNNVIHKKSLEYCSACIKTKMMSPCWFHQQCCGTCMISVHLWTLYFGFLEWRNMLLLFLFLLILFAIISSCTHPSSVVESSVTPLEVGCQGIFESLKRDETVMGLTVFQKSYVEVLTLSSSECDFIKIRGNAYTIS